MKKDKTSKKKKDKSFLFVILVLIIVFGAMLLYVKITNDHSKHTYNNFPFKKDGFLWVTQAEKDGQPYTIPFYYHPTELEDIVAEADAANSLLIASRAYPNTTVFITLDPELESKAVVAAVEISRLAGGRYNILNLKTHGALTRLPDDNLANAQTPIVQCSDVNNETIVIYLTLSQANFIHVEQGCIVLEGTTTEDLLRVADRFAYMILGIMS